MPTKLLESTLQFCLSKRSGFAVATMVAPLALLLIINLVHVLQYAAIHFGYPYELDYGEGVVWQQMRDIIVGDGYRPLTVYPAIVYHYTPVYHLLTAFIAEIASIDQLFAGRLISLLSTFFSAAMVALLTMDLLGQGTSRNVRAICALLTSLLFLSCNPVILWSALMRVDMLSCALSLAGLVACVRCVDRPTYAIAAGFLFTLSVFTKQTSVAAPLAAILSLAFVVPRQALALFATCTVLCSSAFAWLMWSTDGEFIRHTLLYNMNRLYLPHINLLLKELYVHFAMIVMGSIGAWSSWRRLPSFNNLRRHLNQDRDTTLYTTLLLLIFLLLKTVMIATMLKSGANINYIIEWFSALSPFVGVAIYSLMVPISPTHKRSLVLCALVMVALPLQIGSITNWKAPQFARAVHRQSPALQKVVTMIRQSPKPVVSDKMSLLIRADRRVEWEPATIAELGHAGAYDEQAFTAMVRRQRFGFFITEGVRGDPTFDARYNPVVADAIDVAYPRKQIIAGLVFHFPANAFLAPPNRSDGLISGREKGSSHLPSSPWASRL